MYNDMTDNPKKYEDKLKENDLLHGINTNVEVIKVEMGNLRTYILQTSKELGELRKAVQHLDKNAVMRDEHKNVMEQIEAKRLADKKEYEQKHEQINKTMIRIIIIVTLLSASVGSVTGVSMSKMAPSPVRTAETMLQGK